MKKFYSLLQSHPEMRPVLTQVQALQLLQQQFAAVAPEYLVRDSRVLSLRQGVLKIAVRNATVAAKINQMAPILCQKLQQRRCEVSRIRVKVQVDLEQFATSKPQKTFSSAAQHAFRQLEDTLPPSPLQQAVRKILKETS